MIRNQKSFETHKNTGYLSKTSQHSLDQNKYSCFPSIDLIKSLLIVQDTLDLSFYAFVILLRPATYAVAAKETFISGINHWIQMRQVPFEKP